MSLAMTDGEICESYRSAKDQKKQLTMLAQLNATDKGTIAAILRENGYKVDGRWLMDRKRYKPKKAAPADGAAPPPHLEEMPSAPPEPPMWDDAPVGAAISRPQKEHPADPAGADAPDATAAPCVGAGVPDGPEEEPPCASVGAIHESPAVTQPAEDPEPVTVGDLYDALGDLPADAKLLINGLPFGGIHYFKQAAPGGWDETVDLTGQPRTCKELFAELEDT